MGDLVQKICLYGAVIIFAFWVASYDLFILRLPESRIMAPIFYVVEHDNELNWPVVNATVVEWDCCRRYFPSEVPSPYLSRVCSKNGCRYQPKWIVEFFREDGHPSTDDRGGCMLTYVLNLPLFPAFTGFWRVPYYGGTLSPSSSIFVISQAMTGFQHEVGLKL